MTRIQSKHGGRRRPKPTWHVFGAPSNYLFISHQSVERLAPIVGRAERLGRALGSDALMLVDASEQIQAVLRQDWFASTELPNDVDLYTFVLTPGLAKRLGPSRPRDAGDSGIMEILLSDWEVGKHQSSQELFQNLRQYLLSHTEYIFEATVLTGRPLSVRETTPRRNHQADIQALIGLRQRLREDIAMLDSEEWGQLRGVSNNPSATLGKYREQGRLFAVREGRNYLYPRFQFDDDDAPLEVIAEVLKVIPKDAQGWPLLSWFDAPSALLNGRKPRETLARDPVAVKAAAADFYIGD
jgi:hypothetical protein